jgi:DNA-binding MarR family transcriptional regulator
MSIEKDIKQRSFKSPYNKVAVNLMYTNGWVMHNYGKLLKPINLTPQQFHVLSTLKESNDQPITISEIIDKMVDKMSNVSRLVDKLVDKKMVVKVKSPSDGRAVHVLLTKKGLEVFNHATLIINEWKNGTNCLNEAEFLLLNSLLERIKTSQVCNSVVLSS